MRIMLCEYKNGLYGEVIQYKSITHGGSMTTMPFTDFSISLTHNLNGICTQIDIDRVYRNTFGYAVLDIHSIALDNFELTKLIILKSRIICKIGEEGTKDKLIDINMISKKNKDIVREYLKYRNITLKSIFDDIINYDIKL